MDSIDPTVPWGGTAKSHVLPMESLASLSWGFSTAFLSQLWDQPVWYCPSLSWPVCAEHPPLFMLLLFLWQKNSCSPEIPTTQHRRLKEKREMLLEIHANLETSQDALVLIARMLHTVGKCPADENKAS